MSDYFQHSAGFGLSGVVFVHNYQKRCGRFFHISGSPIESCNGNKKKPHLKKTFCYRKFPAEVKVESTMNFHAPISHLQ